jgi:Fungal specific transcription factor domain
MELIETQLDTILRLYGRAESDESSEICSLLKKCKKLGQAMKAQPLILQPLPTYCRDFVPPRKMCDQLVHSYVQTFEHVYRVLHVPSFQQDYIRYWNNPQSASTAFVMRLLLVTAIGSCFHQDSSNLASLRSSSSQWVYMAQSWLSMPLEKSCINLSHVQIHCLLLLARQVNAVGGDLVWVPSGSLLRTAMHIGLHRDPRHLPPMSFLHSELRRRLWATVMEIVLQSSMDAGGPPLISCQDFDTEPPSNFDDAQLDEAMKTEPVPKQMDVFTQTSVQMALMKSLSVRLQVARLASDFRAELSYDETLRLGAELSAVCRSNTVLFQSFRKDQGQPTSFHTKILDLLTHRFLLTLHHPFAIKAKRNPTYYFSRKICQECSLSLLSYTPSPLDTRVKEDDYTRIRLLGGGLFRDVPLHATMVISQELINQLLEDSSLFISASNSPCRNEFQRAIEDYVELTLSRIKAGEVNVKGYVFASCILAQINAMQAGTSIEGSILQELTKSLKLCYRLLRLRVEESPLSEPTTDEIGDGPQNSEIGSRLDGFEWDDLVRTPCLRLH